MAKFSVSLKVTGFELNIQGEREDIALIGRNVADQFSGLVQPSIGIVNGRSPSPSRPDAIQPVVQIENSGKRGSRKRTSASRSEPAENGDAAVNFQHDSARFGMPQQSWNTALKSMWLLYVLKESGMAGDFSAKQITETFNKQFRQSGMIKSFNVTRDLGKLKATEKPSPLGENTSIDPHGWFLTDAGIRRAQELVGGALGGKQTDGAG